MFQVNADESEGDDIFVVAGYSATVEAWEAFTDDWLEVLGRYGNNRPFKMSEALSRYGQARYNLIMPELYGVIEKHVSYGIGFAVQVSMLKTILADIHPKEGEPDHRDPYYFIFYQLIGNIMNNHPDISEENKISFVFDENNRKKKIKDTWEKFMSYAPASAKFALEAEPDFRTDNSWVPLQAADLIAWWIRRRFIERIHNKATRRFPTPRTKKIPGITKLCDEKFLREWRALSRGEPVFKMSSDGSIDILLGGAKIGLRPFR